jgi:hypothetical protein
VAQPPSVHRYVYGWNRPTLFVDPDGREVQLAGYTFDEKGNPVPKLTDETTVIANPTVQQIEEQARRGEISQAEGVALATGTRLNQTLGAPKRDFEKSYARNLAEETVGNIAEAVAAPGLTTFEGLANQDPTQIAQGLAEQAAVGVVGVGLRAGTAALIERFPALAKPLAQIIREGRMRVVAEPAMEAAPKAVPRVAGASQGADTAIADFSYLVDEAGLTTRAEGRITGPHRGRGKGYRPEPVGGRAPGEHRGHLVPEGGVDNPALVNVKANIISETPTSNLGPKKSLDLLVSKLAAENPNSIIRIIAEPLRRQGETRPFAVTYWVEQDGERVMGQTILNKKR